MKNRGLGYFSLNIRNCIELKNLSYIHLDKIKSNLDGGIGRLVMFYIMATECSLLNVEN